MEKRNFFLIYNIALSSKLIRMCLRFNANLNLSNNFFQLLRVFNFFYYYYYY